MKFKHTLIIAFLLLTAVVNAQELPIWNPTKQPAITHDWLVTPVAAKAGIFKSADGKDIILYNGLTKRIFRISPNLACTDYTNLTTGRQLLRAVSPEAKLT